VNPRALIFLNNFDYGRQNIFGFYAIKFPTLPKKMEAGT
jgi:hypothetical protein